MPNIASVLKEEIARIARKEVNAGTERTRKASAQYRRDIAELKRQVSSLSKHIAKLERAEQKRSSAVTPSADASNIRFSPKGLHAHREKLGLSANDYATLIGVSAQTIYGWEQGKRKPRQQQLAAIAAARSIGKREAQQILETMQET